jgi:hypothetical protein
VFLECKKVSKVVFFWDLFSFFLTYFYLLEGSKIFFLSSKCFIWIVQVLIYLKEFSWNFCDFRNIFRAFKQFLDFSGICFRIKNKLEKRKPILPDWAEPVARPNPLRPRRQESAKQA